MLTWAGPLHSKGQGLPHRGSALGCAKAIMLPGLGPLKAALSRSWVSLHRRGYLGHWKPGPGPASPQAESAGCREGSGEALVWELPLVFFRVGPVKQAGRVLSVTSPQNGEDFPAPAAEPSSDAQGLFRKY